MKKCISLLVLFLYWAKMQAQEVNEVVKEIASDSVSFEQLYSEKFFLVWGILAIVLFVFLRLKSKYGNLTGWLHYFQWGAIMLISVCELWIPYKYGDDLDKVIAPNGEPLMFFLILIPLIITIIIQTMSYFNIMDDFRYNYDVDCSIIWPPIILVGGAIVAIISMIFEAWIIFYVVFFSTVIYQIVHIVRMFYKSFKSTKNPFVAIACVTTYIVGILALLLIGSFVLLGILGLKAGKFILSGLGGHRSSYYDYY